MCSHARTTETCKSFYPRWAELISDLITMLHIRTTDKEAQNNSVKKNLTVAGTMLHCKNKRWIFCMWLMKRTWRPGPHWPFQKHLPQREIEWLYPSQLKPTTAEHQSLSDNTSAQTKWQAMALIKDFTFPTNDGISLFHKS